MNSRDVAVGAVVASAAGVGFAWTHGAWYGVFATSPLVDLFGSLLLGVVGALACLLAGALADGARRAVVAGGFATGGLAHLVVTPTVTPFALGPADVNAALFAVGAALGLVALAASERRET
jgi:hypothetical protein